MPNKPLPPIIDMHLVDEDLRIATIGHSVMDHKIIAGVLVEDDEPGKPERYIEKLTERFPGIRILSQGPGPDRTILIRVGPPIDV